MTTTTARVWKFHQSKERGVSYDVFVGDVLIGQIADAWHPVSGTSWHIVGNDAELFWKRDDAAARLLAHYLSEHGSDSLPLTDAPRMCTGQAYESLGKIGHYGACYNAAVEQVGEHWYCKRHAPSAHKAQTTILRRQLDDLRRQLDTAVWDYVQRVSLHDLEADRLMWIRVALREGRVDDAAALLARETAEVVGVAPVAASRPSNAVVTY